MDFKDTAHQRIWKVMQYLRDQQAIARKQEFDIDLRSIAEEGISEQDFFNVLKLLQDDGIIFSDNSHPFLGPVHVSIDMYPEVIMEYMEDFKRKKSEPELSPLAETTDTEIYFDPSSGEGFVNDKSFHLRIGTRYHLVFSELYEKLSRPLSSARVKHLVGGRHNAKYLVNDMAVKLRAKVGLTTKQLVQNAGNLILIAKKRLNKQ